MNKIFNTYEVLYPHCDGVLPITSTHVVLVLRKNLYPATIKTPYVAGIPAGVFSLDTKENGEGKINFDPQDKTSFKRIMARQIAESLNSFSLKTTPSRLHALGEIVFDATQGDQRAGNGVKELVEETGLVATRLLPFHHQQINTKYQQQNLYLADQFFVFCSKSQDFKHVKDLTRVRNFMKVDADIDKVMCVPIPEVFTSEVFTIIGTHKRPLEKAINFYKDFKKKSA